MDYNNYNQNNQQQNNYQQPAQPPVYQQTVYQQAPQQTPGNGAGIASMVCGILSIAFCWCYGIVGLILGIIAIAMYSKSKRMNGGLVIGMARAGMICGIIGSILSALMLIYFIFVICVAGVTTSSIYWLNEYLPY